jgi:hypothetical protein
LQIVRDYLSISEEGVQKNTQSKGIDRT